MSTKDTCCTLVPYFSVHEGKMGEFKQLCQAFVEKTSTEDKCMFYGFSFSGNEAHCREGYEDAEGVLSHLENVAAIFEQALNIADITRLEVHAPQSQLDQLKAPLSHLSPQLFTLEMGFRRSGIAEAV